MSAKQFYQNQTSRIWVGVFLGIGLFIGLGIAFLPQGPTQYPKYVTESPSPSGIKAFYTLLEKEFPQVETWQKPAQTLPFLTSRQLMIIVEPSTPFNSSQLEQWIKWMEAGNQLWLLDRNPKGLFHLETSLIDPAANPDTNVDINQEANLHSSVEGFEEWKGTHLATLETTVRLEAESEDHVLLKDQQGIIALSRVYGQGELMVLLAPEWLTNSLILQEDHLQLVLPFIVRADPQVIWVNEFVHSNSPSGLGVYPEWFVLLLTQGLISFLLWLWYKGKRFGSIRTPREWVVRFGDERIRALAAWYERGKFYKESLEIQDEFLRHAVQERWGIQANLSGSEFIEATLQRLPMAKQQQGLQTWSELKKANPDKISLKLFLKWSKFLDDMQKEVERR
ncbi:DUF4350 domain-containing protein [Desulfosporosinus meridiei]|uniref:DUF4350 domain-containing protein n=1 Tax=Desulfosporosinus meridiei (strain ATCC BAA-275 / DSM 13257 / KCTC 12902 / NCIMB 13706 / S10) TaxID=768704 RepID=J7IYL6_DESMD|nr:DUF4350 domain-containing protein [Desulfosporosinus meridiei]AFQ45239.1 hypothetical protein Desmer_3373 [Desulfosporosinus meridiei DSM 13257]